MRDSRPGNFLRLDRPILEESELTEVVPLSLPTVEQLRAGGGATLIRLDTDNRPSFDEQLSAAFEEGRQQGLSQGQAQAESRLADQIQRATEMTAMLNAAVVGLSSQVRESMMIVEPNLARLSLEIAKEILGAEPSIDHERLGRGIREALAHIEPEIDVRVRVHPSHVEDLSRSLESGEVQAAHVIEVIGDQTIERGGAVVEAGPTRIDTQIKAAIERLHGVLFEIEGSQP